ncbi:MAG: hypothetical protein HC803_07430 [Saprospiraceae bacterium]|nr:hypothetical protein [Saprospiraceae bacterium]
MTLESAENVLLKIQDNGNGFELENTDFEGHYGLENMEQRTKDINGKFNIKTEIGKGVLIEVFLSC